MHFLALPPLLAAVGCLGPHPACVLTLCFLLPPTLLPSMIRQAPSGSMSRRTTAPTIPTSVVAETADDDLHDVGGSASRHSHTPSATGTRCDFFSSLGRPVAFFLFLFVILVGFFWCVLPTRLASIVVFASAASRYTKRVPVKGLTTVATRVLNWYLAPARPLDNKTFLPLVPLSLFRPTRVFSVDTGGQLEPVAEASGLGPSRWRR